jgi:integrin alpha FG-GAP repeat containing protein 1
LDLHADIFLTCQEGGGEQSYQIWINNKAAGFSLARTGALPFATKHVSFADMGQ